MDQDVRDALQDIKTSVRDGFAGIDRRFTDLVTIGEFRATVERQDTQHAILRRDFEQHTNQTADIVAASEARDATIAAASEARDIALRSEFRQDLDGFRSTTKWAVGIATTAVGLVCTVVTIVINAIQ